MADFLVLYFFYFLRLLSLSSFSSFIITFISFADDRAPHVLSLLHLKKTVTVCVNLWSRCVRSQEFENSESFCTSTFYFGCSDDHWSVFRQNSTTNSNTHSRHTDSAPIKSGKISVLCRSIKVFLLVDVFIVWCTSVFECRMSL